MTDVRRRIMLPELPKNTYVVGDIHGCLDLYDALEARIISHADGRNPILIVAVGDIIDRGPNSADVVDRMMEPPPLGVQRLALCGNHEAMFLDFLNGLRGPVPWLKNGGEETLISYGLPYHPQSGFDQGSKRLLRMVEATVPHDHREFLRSMPISLRLPGYLICHAGLNPSRALAEQSDNDLMWSDPSSIDEATPQSPAITDMEALGVRLIHGHVPQPRVVINERRIAVDTGAYGSGVLSAVRLNADRGVEVLRVSRRVEDIG